MEDSNEDSEKVLLQGEYCMIEEVGPWLVQVGPLRELSSTQLMFEPSLF